MAVSGVTLRFVLYDILRDMRQRYTQADISEYQVMYWILIHADRLKKQHIEKRRSGEYLYSWLVQVIEGSDGRFYFELPARIYDFDDDRGIDHISYFNFSASEADYFNKVFSRTTPSQIQRLNWRSEEQPNYANPYFYRLGDYVYLLGPETAVSGSSTVMEDDDYVEVGLFTSFDPTLLDSDLNNYNLDDYFDFPQDLIPVLKRQVLDLGLFITSLPKDLVNDGSDTPMDTPQKKLISVNNLNTQEQ